MLRELFSRTVSWPGIPDPPSTVSGFGFLDGGVMHMFPSAVAVSDFIDLVSSLRPIREMAVEVMGHSHVLHKRAMSYVASSL